MLTTFQVSLLRERLGIVGPNMNEIDIFYFSGTGNSLVVARDVARGTKARLTPIASVINRGQITVEAGAFGIVFPVYYETYGGVPLIIYRFVSKLKGIGSKYIFAICTYGSGSIVTLRRLGKAIRSVGGRLAAGFTVSMPENVASSRYNYPELQRRMFSTWKQTSMEIFEFINARKHGGFRTPNV
jgi:flavodoxin